MPDIPVVENTDLPAFKFDRYELSELPNAEPIADDDSPSIADPTLDPPNPALLASSFAMLDPFLLTDDDGLVDDPVLLLIIESLKVEPAFDPVNDPLTFDPVEEPTVEEPTFDPGDDCGLGDEFSLSGEDEALLSMVLPNLLPALLPAAEPVASDKLLLMVDPAFEPASEPMYESSADEGILEPSPDLKPEPVSESSVEDTSLDDPVSDDPSADDGPKPSIADLMPDPVPEI